VWFFHYVNNYIYLKNERKRRRGRRREGNEKSGEGINMEER
jgi:hypothetical protein